jgi:hypothetical protein
MALNCSAKAENPKACWLRIEGLLRGASPAPSDSEVRDLIKQGTMQGFGSFSEVELADLIANLRTL